MDAENAAAAADLENGGGGGAVTVETWPWPADRQLKEKQPFTWLGGAPCIAVVLLGAVLFAVGVAVVVSCSAREDAKQQGQAGRQPLGLTTGEVVGTVLYANGTLLLFLGIIAAAIASDEGCCGECNLQRFGPD